MGRHAKAASLASWPIRRIVLTLVAVTIVALGVTLAGSRSKPGPQAVTQLALPSLTSQLEGQGYQRQPFVELFRLGKQVVRAAIWLGESVVDPSGRRTHHIWVLMYHGKVLSIGTQADWCEVPSLPVLADQLLVASVCLQRGPALPASVRYQTFVVPTPLGPMRVKYSLRNFLP